MGARKGRRSAGGVVPVEAKPKHPVQPSVRVLSDVRALVVPDYPPVEVCASSGEVVGTAVDWRAVSAGDVARVFRAAATLGKALDGALSASVEGADWETVAAIDDIVNDALADGLAVFFSPAAAHDRLMTQAWRRDLLMAWLNSVNRAVPPEVSDPQKPDGA